MPNKIVNFITKINFLEINIDLSVYLVSNCGKYIGRNRNSLNFSRIVPDMGDKEWRNV